MRVCLCVRARVQPPLRREEMVVFEAVFCELDGGRSQLQQIAAKPRQPDANRMCFLIGKQGGLLKSCSRTLLPCPPHLPFPRARPGVLAHSRPVVPPVCLGSRQPGAQVPQNSPRGRQWPRSMFLPWARGLGGQDAGGRSPTAIRWFPQHVGAPGPALVTGSQAVDKVAGPGGEAPTCHPDGVGQGPTPAEPPGWSIILDGGTRR